MEPIQEKSKQLQHPARRPARQSWSRYLMGIGLVAVAGAVGVMVGIIPIPVAAHIPSVKHDAVLETRIPTVKAVRPKPERGCEIQLERMAIVEPYYRADLRTRASGIVKMVHHDIGDSVKRGDILIEIDVPESDQEVSQKAALIVQREQELRVSESRLKDARAAISVTTATITQREADVQGIEATRDLKKRRFDRFKSLAATGSVVGSVVEEEERDYLASEAALLSAKANVARARADNAESMSKVDTAESDVELKRSQIEVAKADLDRAKVVAEFGKVIAPFDGIVVRRNVDPGSFVQNATSANSEALISVSRIDLVTVVAQFPDNAAPYITVGTPALLHISDFSGRAISSKVTRLAPTIQSSDRTMLVEVDLFNGGPAQRRECLERSNSESVSAMLKGNAKFFPENAFDNDDDADRRRLMPGMNGSLRLAIGAAGTAFVLPSTAVFSKSGAKYILVIRNGKTQVLPVKVQLNDGQRVQLAIVSRKTSTEGTVAEDLTDLEEDEIVVVANQLQIDDGIDVHVSLTEW